MSNRNEIVKAKNIKKIELKRLKRIKKKYKSLAKGTSKLADPNYEASLYTKYSHYNDYGLKPVIDSLVNLWLILNNSVNSKEFTNTGTSYINPFARPQRSLDAVYSHIINSISNTNNYFSVFNEGTEIKINLPEITFRLGFGMGHNLVQHQLQDKTREQCEKIIQSFLPNFKLPDFWVAAKNSLTGAPYAKPNISTVKTEKRIDLEHFKDIEIPYSPHLDWTGPTDFDLAPNFKTNYDGDVSIELEINEENARIVGSGVNLSRNTGQLMRSGLVVEFTMAIRAYVKFPMEYSLWATSCTDHSQFVERTFFDFVQSMITHSIRGTVKKSMPIRITNIIAVKQRNEEKLRYTDFSPRARTNKEGYSVLSNGFIVWIPGIDNTNEYSASVKQSYDPVSRTIRTISELSRDDKIKYIRNSPIYSDWANNRFAYTNDSGQLITINLEGAIALDNITIARILNTSILNKTLNGSVFHIEAFFRLMERQSELLGAVPDEIKNKGYPFYTLNSMLMFLKENGADVTFANLAGKPYNDEGNTKINEVIKAIRETLKGLAPRITEMRMSFLQRMEVVKFGFDLIFTYGEKYASYENTYNLSLKLNDTTHIYDENGEPVSLDYETLHKLGQEGIFDIPNLPNVKSALPHQGQIIAALGSCPRYRILSVDPGGGKSFTIISDIMLLKKAGKIGKALVVVPGNLVREFINDVHKFAGNQINMFPLTIETVREKLVKTLGWTSNDIVNYIKNAPENTIFITSYNFIRNMTDIDSGQIVRPIIYGSEEIVQFPIVDLLRRCEFSYLVNDESQSIKRKEAQRTRALNILAADIPYRGIATGTIVSTSPKDIVGQVHIINPSIFSSEDIFSLRYGILENQSGRGRKSKTPKVISWKSNVGIGVKEELAPYAQYHKKTHADWAFLLPPIREHFIPADEFTDHQKEFYDNIMNEAFDTILQNPRLMEKLKAGNPEDEKEIENALDRYLAKVEIFINAPDANEGYRATVDPDNIDELKSPKVDIVDALIDAHFNGGTVKGATFKPDNGKIIVFGYNVDVSKHLMRHTRHKDIAIHYSAGNIEALEEFRNPNSKYKVLFADESGIKEGFNIQIASHLIRLQALWSPGDQNQALARIYRPDVENVYDRDEIRFTWVICEHTIEIPKVARLISRIIDKAKADFGEELPGSVKNSGLELITMSLDTIKDFKTFEDIQNHKGVNYFNVYKRFVTWQDTKVQRSREQMIEFAQKLTGRTDLSKTEVVKAVMIPVYSTDKLNGSKEIYVPRITGVKSINSHLKINVIPAATVNIVDDEDEAEETDAVLLKPGDLVDTEFGPGTVLRVKKRIRVKVKAIDKPITLPRSVIGIPATRKDRKRLRKYHKSDLGNSLVPDGFFINKNKAIDEEDLDDAEIKNQVEIEKVNIELSVINGLPTLWTVTDNANIEVISRKQNWKVIPPFIAAHITRAEGIDYFIKEVEKKGLTINSVSKINLLRMEKRLRTEKTRLMRGEKTNFGKRWRDFFLNSHRRVTSKKEVRVYPFVWENKLYLALNSKIHNSNVLNQLMRIPAAPGYRRFKTYDYEMYVYPFRDKTKAVSELKEINKYIDIENYIDLLDKVRSVHIT